MSNPNETEHTHPGLVIPDLKESGMDATAEDFETAVKFIKTDLEKEEEDEFRRQEAIRNIEGLYPPDSEYPNTAAIGEKLLMSIVVEEWRDLPLYTLQRFSSSCTQKDNLGY